MNTTTQSTSAEKPTMNAAGEVSSQEEETPAHATEGSGSTPALALGAGKKRKLTFMERVEGFISKLSTRNNFWHRVCAMIWLPYAFKSGIKMAKGDPTTFSYVLPFRRINRNWYNAMAGAALLANSEVAGGMYIFKRAGKDYTVVCKELNYQFLRPCFGPAVYKVVPNSELDALIKSGTEFNADVTLNIFQPPAKPSEREKRVGRCKAVFHVTPKLHHKDRKQAGRKTAVR